MPINYLDEPKSKITYLDEQEKIDSVIQKQPTISDKIKQGLGLYMKEAQPAFKWVASGMPKELPNIEQAEKSNWADIYRQSGAKNVGEPGVLPFAKSTSTTGQMIPQIIGEGLGLATKPSSYIAPRAIKQGAKLIPKIGEHLPQVMGKNYTTKQSETISSELNNIKKLFGSDVGETVTKASPKSVDVAGLSKRLPEKIPEKITKAVSDPLYKIEILEDGSLKPTVGNMQKMLDLIDDKMSGKDWIEASDLEKEGMRKVYGAIRESMGEAAPEIKAPYQAYTEFKPREETVRRLVQKNVGGKRVTVEKPLRAAFKPDAEATTKNALTEMGEISPKIRQAIKNMKKFEGRQETKSLAKRVAWRTLPWAAGTAVGVPILASILGGRNK